ncbi:rhodanese-like domain-containing protein [Patescibacteria group bacterium]|nr:rhodanese-like domain-containing protein [Patescibacteria group bacterium]
MMDVEPKRLKEEMKKNTSMTVVDLQEPLKYEHSHIPGAVNIPAEAFEQDYPGLLKDKDATIVLYGEFEELGKGVKFGQMLEAAGYEKVGHVVGGLMGWQEAGYPTEGGRES